MQRPIPASSDEDPTGAATVVDARNRTRAHETTDELMQEVPGARHRTTGAIGAFAGVSLRGADLEHTTVLLDTIPLGPVEGGAFDLSTVPLSLLERVEVYRGGAPLWLGSGGIGGVVRLLPRETESTSAEGTVGVGSFGTVRANAAASVVGEEGTPSWMAVVGARHTDGDYPYLDTGGTLDPSDDVQRRRQNAHLDEAWSLMRGRVAAGDGTLTVLATGYGRTGGLAGSPVEEPVHTRRNLARMLGAMTYELGRGARRGSDESWRLQLTAASGYERHRFDDPFGEIALTPRATDDRTLRNFVRAAGSVEATQWLELATVASYSLERFAPDDALVRTKTSTSLRHTGAVGAEARVRGRIGRARAQLRASGQMQVSGARLTDIRRGREGASRTARMVMPTARLGAVVEPVSNLALSASAATSTRIPSLVELFGDRGFLLGDTTLQPERSVSTELGAVARGRAGIVDGTLELRVFALFVRDLIRYVRSSQYQLVPQNVANARIYGGELGLRGRVGRWVRLTGAVTLMHARDREQQRALPLRPRLQGYGRPELVLGPFGPVDEVALFADVTHVASNFVDSRNIAVVPSRTLIGAGTALETLTHRLRVELAIRDVLDARPFDLVGFPLPGRRVALDVTVRTGEIP